MKLVTVRDEGTIRYLELNNVATKNSLDLTMAEHLLHAIVEANLNSECKVIVFCSTGRAHFSSGPDLEQLITLTEHDNGQNLLDHVVTVLNRIIIEIYQSPKITMAAVHGFAYGGGLNIMLPCDFRLTVHNAKFIENFLYMGVTPDLSSSYFLPRLIGISKTTELLLTGRLFTGQEATEWGLFQESFAKRSEMMERVEQLGKQFDSLELEVVAKMKELLRVSHSHSLQEQIEIEQQSLLKAFQHPDIKSNLLRVYNKKLL